MTATLSHGPPKADWLAIETREPSQPGELERRPGKLGGRMRELPLSPGARLSLSNS